MSVSPEDILKNKLNGLLTERQKNDILKAMQGMDKKELLRIIEATGISKMSDTELISAVSNADKDKIAQALRRML